MESLIKQQFNDFLNKNSMLDKTQYGFRSGKSTGLQLLYCTKFWTSCIDNKSAVDVVYLDFAKAFDTVSHPKLFGKLEKIGVQDDLML